MNNVAIEQYDVVIIGSGGAGLRAALAAAEQGAKPVILTKGGAEWSGGTLSAHFSFCGILPEPTPGDSPEVFAKDIIKSGEGMSNPELVTILAEQSGEAIAYTQQLGVKFDINKETNQPNLAWLAGHSYARAVHVGNAVGRQVVRALLREVKKLNIAVHAFTHATDLIVEDEQCKGVVAYHIPTGELRVYQAPAVVMATGGGSQVYELNTNPLELTGDGYALALRAGIELVDMEFVQFYPSVLVAPTGARGLMFNSGILIPKGARLLNKHGEDFWDKYDVGPLKEATRDTLSWVMSQEILKGNGTENGGLYISTEGMDHREFPEMQQRLLEDVGLPADSTRREVAPGAHYFMGGLRIDKDASTSMPGVYAAGECAGGIHGANRLAGAALTENQVWGKIAGQHAAIYALAKKSKQSMDVNLKPYMEPISQLVERAGEEGLNPNMGWKEIQSLMQTHVGPTRTAERLKQAELELETWKTRKFDEIRVRDTSKRYNRDIARALDLRNMIDTGWCIAVVAQKREETRGAHVRLDFPTRDDKNWKRSLAFTRQGSLVKFRSIYHEEVLTDAE